jgi:hypothetical protein
MPLDPAILGNLAAEQMAALEEAFGDEDVQIAGAITIVEVLRVHTRDAQGNPVAGQADVRMRVNIGDPFHVIGVLDQAKYQLLSGPGIGAQPEGE